MNATALLPVVLMIVAGATLAVQAPTNAMLARGLGTPVNAALISFVIGTVGLLAVAMISPTRPDLAAARSLPWWAWVGGLYGAVFVASMAFAAPRIGITAALTIATASQLALALYLDHVGALGLDVRPLSLMKVAGVLLVGVGVILVRRG